MLEMYTSIVHAIIDGAIYRRLPLGYEFESTVLSESEELGTQEHLSTEIFPSHSNKHKKEKANKRIEKKREWPRGVMVKAMDCEIVVSEFELKSRYDARFRANTLGKGMNPRLNSTTTIG